MTAVRPRSAAAPRAMSDGEATLAWQIKVTGLPGPLHEYRFDPRRMWRADFAWPEHRLLVEVEGGTYTAGRHTRAGGFEDDCEKYAEAMLAGWRVLRVTTAMVDDGRALAFVERALREDHHAEP